LIFSDVDADLVVVPSLPVTVSVELPFLALDVTVTVTVADPFPPEIEAVDDAIVTPVVPPAKDRVTLPV
jgi:hypothetical protein